MSCGHFTTSIIFVKMYSLLALLVLVQIVNASPKPYNAHRAGRHIEDSLANLGAGFSNGAIGKPSNSYGAPFGAGSGATASGSLAPPPNLYGAPTGGGFNGNGGSARGQSGGTQGGHVGGGGLSQVVRGGELSQVGNGGLSVGLLGEAARLLTGGLSVGLEGGISNLGKGLELPNYLGSLPSVEGANGCICPEKNGWSNEQLIHNQRYTNISAGRFDCYCIGKAGFVLVKKGPGGVRVGNGNSGGSGGTVDGNRGGNTRGGGGAGGDGGYVNGGYPAGTGGAGFPGGFRTSGGATVNDKPTMSCFCPKSSGWTYDQLSLLLRQRNFSGGVNDCYCGNPSEYSAELSEQLKSFRADSSRDSGGSDEDNQSHLAIVSLDGDIKEVRLGPLFVELA